MGEFREFMGNRHFRSYFEVRGIDIRDAELFFAMLAAVSDSDEVPINSFVAGCLRMKGYASSADLHTAHFEQKLMHRNFKEFKKTTEGELEELKSVLQSQLIQLSEQLSEQLAQMDHVARKDQPVLPLVLAQPKDSSLAAPGFEKDRQSGLSSSESDWFRRRGAEVRTQENGGCNPEAKSVFPVCL